MSEGENQQGDGAPLRADWAQAALDFCEQPLALLIESALDRPLWLNRAMQLWWQAHGSGSPAFRFIHGELGPDLHGSPGSLPLCRYQRLRDPSAGEYSAAGNLLLVRFELFSSPPGVLPAEPLTGGIDPVTEIADRVALDRELSERFSQAADHPFALIFIDLDGFKAVNDTQGHLAGDRSLRAIAQKLHNSVRDSDFVGRFGGDEFVVLLSGIRSEQDLQGPLTRLRQAIAEDPEPALRASFGASCSREDFPSAEAMLHAADERMYIAKRQTADSR